MDALAVGGKLPAEVGEGLSQVADEGKRTPCRAELSAFPHVNVDHHEGFRSVRSAFPLKVVGVGACDVVLVVGIPHLAEEALSLCQDREDFGVGVGEAWFQDVVALPIDLELALLVVPARLLEGEVILGGTLPEPGEIGPVGYGGGGEQLVLDCPSLEPRTGSRMSYLILDARASIR